LAAGPGRVRDGHEWLDRGPTGQDVLGRRVQRLLGGDAENRRRGRVPVADDAFVVDQEDAVVDVLEHAGVALERGLLVFDLPVEPAKLERAGEGRDEVVAV